MEIISIGIICIVMPSMTNYAQDLNYYDTVYKKFESEQENINRSFSDYFYGNYAKMYSLNENDFVRAIDSLQKIFTEHLAKFEKEHPNFDNDKLSVESKEIHYYFDKLLVEYPYFHERFAGEKKTINSRLSNNLKDFNNPELLNINSCASCKKTPSHH